MIDPTLLLLFLPTFFMVSITPGMCMLLAMSLGMSLGVRRTVPMMLGEMLGVALVAMAAVFGVATLMLNYPALFVGLKLIGGVYLLYLGLQMWCSKAQLAHADPVSSVRASSLFARGFITAIANPKGWAFMVSLLPPFISAELPLVPQLTVLVGIILLCELTCMLIYASGGSTLRRLLSADKVLWVNRIAGSLMMVLGVWLILD